MLRGPGVAQNPFRADMLCPGDSIAYNTTYLGGDYASYFPSGLERLLTASRLNVGCFNAGHSGATTADRLVFLNALSPPPRPTIGIIYIGTNDIGNAANTGTVQASPAPTTTTFTVDSGKGAVFPAGAAIFRNGANSRLVQSVASDAVTLASALPQAPSAGDTITLDTETNIVAIGARLTALGFTRQIVCIQHYWNWTSSCDTVAAPHAQSEVIRVPQRAAAATLGAVVVDFYALMRQRIVDGLDVQGDHAWHVADLNSHLSAYGERLLAEFIYAAIPASWTSVLR